MYLTSQNVPGPTSFAVTPVQFSDINTAAQQQHQQQQQQQQLHYNLLNFNVAAAAGLISPTPILSSSNNINTNETQSSTQSTSQTNESLQQQQQQPTSNSSSNHPPIQQILLENLYNNVLLREKNPNQLYDSRKNRKRLSDPVFPNQQQQQQPLQPIIINQQQTNVHPFLQQQQQQQQFVQTNVNLSRDLSNHTLNRRRSLRFIKPPIILQTIHQQHEPQKLLVVRHAERVDSTFGSGWLDQVFDKTTGIYRRINLNLPKKMVTRKDLKDFLFDPPLTELGLHECKMVGEELAAQGIEIHHVYASPALRCVQTADKILEGLQLRDKISIRIEPCLFEFLKWYPVVPVKWPFLDLDELTKNGYNVEKSYKPFYPIESLRKDEDESMYYTRSHFIMTSILKNHETDGGNLLIVGHVTEIIFFFFHEENFKFFCFLGTNN
jgi:phosphohistidine phosphatase SixA